MKKVEIAISHQPVQPGGERAQSVVRLVGALCCVLYMSGLYMAGWDAEILPLVPTAVGYLAVCFAYFILTGLYQSFSLPRVVLSIILDQAFYALVPIGGVSGMLALLIAGSISVSIGNGLRYGAVLGYFSSFVGVAFNFAAMYTSPVWRQIPFISAGYLIAIVGLPIYAISLSARLARSKQEIEARTLKLEAIARESQRELRQHKAELAHVARLSTMGEMASGIAHEINQPLTAILSYNQACIRMLRDDESKTEDIVRAMSLAAEQAKRAGEILTRLRSFVKKQSSPNVLVDMNQVVTDTLVLIEHGLRDNQVTIRTDLRHPLPNIVADNILLEQVVLNLIRNAIDVMNNLQPASRRIDISTAVDGDDVVVTVKDNGPGIASDVLAQMFHPFFTTKADGMGLGLTISQSIIESFDGSISARNAPEGGALVIFALPVRHYPGDGLLKGKGHA